jgi:hypothetical protein
MTTLADIITPATKAEIYAKALQVATDLGLPVTSWTAGDPTRSLYHVLAEELNVLEQVAERYVASRFLDYAYAWAVANNDSQWLKLLADQDFGYVADEATYATCTIQLTNNGGGHYELETGQVTVRKPGGASYHNTSTGILTIGPGTTLDLDFVCDEPGSDGSASIGEITEMVTGLLDVDCSNTTAAVGIDEESPLSIVAGCRAKLGALSPNGPADAYSYVATSADLTGTSGVTRVVVVDDSTTGDVLVHLAGPSGAVSGADVALVQTAIATYATPLCITATAASATNRTIDIAYTLDIYTDVNETDAAIIAAVSTALDAMFVAHPIGGDSNNELTTKLIEATIMGAFAGYAYGVTLTAPASSVGLTASQVAVKGTVAAVVNQTVRPK